ncbi:MAG TPA: glycosyltransferase family 9 protein [Planctomycetota bacterium]|nr:glycosyltransferase family 9 protein [Planctomycetota bacterium]
MSTRDRCLVLRPGALGDAILSLGAFELIRREHPGLRMVLAAGPAGCRVGELSGIFDQTMPYESPEFSGLFLEDEEPGRLLENVSALVAFGAGGADSIALRAEESGVRRACAVDTWPDPDGGHVAEQLVERTAEVLGVDLAAEPLEMVRRRPAADDFSAPEGAFELPPLRVGPDHSAWSARPGPRVAVAPGAGSPGKCWPAADFAAACRLIARRGPVHFMLVLGPAEMERPEIGEAFRGLDCSLSECWSVRDLAAVFAASHLYLGNDSGLSHLAAWAGARGLAVFGPTDPELWAPVGAVEPVPMRGLFPESLAEMAGEMLDSA